MSVQAMSWVFDHAETGSIGDRLVLLSIANHADKYGRGAFPKIAYLAQESRLSERQVIRALKRLETEGLIAPDEWPGDRVEPPSNRRPRCWRIVPMPGVTSRHPKNEPGVTSMTSRGDISDGSGVTSTTAHKEEPSLEPSIEPSLGSISFDRFYETFPRHQGKGAAKKAWAKALTKISPEELLTSAARYRDDPNRDPEYTCLPATWLNQERWSDDPLPSHNGRRYEGTLDRMAHDLMKGVNGDYRTNEGPSPSTVRRLPR